MKVSDANGIAGLVARSGKTYRIAAEVDKDDGKLFNAVYVAESPMIAPHDFWSLTSGRGEIAACSDRYLIPATQR